MATSPGHELDLSSDMPSPAGYEPPLDRFDGTFNVDGEGFGVSAVFRVKGTLQPSAELLVLCVCSLLTVLVFAHVCRFSDIEDWRLTAICTAVGLAMFAGGAWYLAARRHSYPPK